MMAISSSSVISERPACRPIRSAAIPARFTPARPGLEPEDLRRDVAAAGGVEQEAGDLGVGLGLAHVEFVPVVLAQCLGIDLDHPCDIELWDAIGRQSLDLPA